MTVTPCSASFAAATFVGAYVDLCTGSADEVLANLEAVLPRMAPRAALAYTMTGRDPRGEDMVTRHGRVVDRLGDAGFLYADGRAATSVCTFRSPTTTVLTAFFKRAAE